jgi:MoaA/NifB/PqqE/SkfB family radical SAM enzyme
MSTQDIRTIVEQAKDHDAVEWIYFEGGEPFLYYPVLVKGVEEVVKAGFKVGIVTNAYWAENVEDAVDWLQPFSGVVGDLSVSSDLFHYDEEQSRQVENARKAAKKLNIPIGVISIAQPESENAEAASGQLPLGGSAVMYRGRAAQKLIGKATGHPWEDFDECPYEDLENPGRVHIDPAGELHICQGITIGNLNRTPLNDICENFDVDSHPILQALIAGGPAELTRRYASGTQAEYVDACHLCYESREKLRAKFPEWLLPDQMYGVGID